MSSMRVQQLSGWLRRFNQAVQAEKSYLTELDSAIGDADHGSNMARGMAAVVDKAADLGEVDVETLFKAVGMTLVTTVGGASGPLYGTFFLRFATAGGPTAELDASGLSAALRSGLEGVVTRGKAEAGDKTMFDALEPALDAFDAALSAGSNIATAADAAAAAAASARDATAPLVARKGRASYLGERSAGHIDPGAASAALLMRALADAASEAVEG